MNNKKKIIIKGTKKQKILLGLQMLIVVFILVFTVVAKHVLKIDDSIISKTIFIGVAIVFGLMLIINSLEKDDDKDEDTKTKE